mmetsp:Transcript_53163/g.142141  ORF Transcript_53163/g.142141 Transcript_53163/m.142141 type:complete len:480 (-) Transcript_53163:197-1636(-)
MMLLPAAMILLLGAAAAAEGPCDLLGAGGNPCVAAHSTVRALYANYTGPLYNVTRASDGKSALIGVLSTGGFANKSQHDEFCSKLDCVISNVMDQSGRNNHLGQRHELVNASLHSITVGPSKTPVYGMWFEPGFGYHVDQTNGIATGNDPESIYAVMSGKQYNGDCCFDYGNSETDDRDDGCGTMEAIYFGNAHWSGNTGAGDGPWAGADLEQGMYYGGGAQTKVNNYSKPLTHDFVSLTLKGRTDGFTLKGGDATNGTQATMYDGPRPDRDLAGTCGGGKSATISLQKCVWGSSNQTWAFEEDGKSIASGGFCFDIGGYKTTKGSNIYAWPCGMGSHDNEFWSISDGTISSLQPNTPFCVGVKGTAVGSTTVLDDCNSSTSALTVDFTTISGTGSIMQKASGLCLTAESKAGYQPMRKKGAIVLATGGDNSNSAKGCFYEGFMATGVASDAMDASIQENIVAVGYSGWSPADLSWMYV